MAYPGRALPLLARFTIRRPARRLAGYLVAVAGTVALTAVLLPFRTDIQPLSKGFGYLAVVVAAAAIGGLGAGITASALGFLTFNFYFLPPYDSFAIGRAEDIVVLFVFLGLSIVISAALAHATERADVAEQRRAELAGLQELSAQLVARQAAPGSGGYEPVLARVAEVFGCDSCVLALDGEAPATPISVPLAAGGRALGYLGLSGRPPLTVAEHRVLQAFGDQLALAAERDRAVRAALEAEVYRETDHMRRSLLAAVSHDLRSPLAAIKASVTDLLDTDADHSATDVREALESVNGETDRLASMIANLLDMSRIEGGVLRARIQGVDLAGILSEVTDRVGRRWPALEMRLAVDEDASAVRADPPFLERVVANLLENAARVSAGTGARSIEVQAHRRGGTTTVAVVDHGPGVAAELRDQLFYPFYRLGERNPSLGTGLGLAICKGFLGLMGGEIWVEDTPGGGATFRFSLPAAA